MCIIGVGVCGRVRKCCAMVVIASDVMHHVESSTRSAEPATEGTLVCASMYPARYSFSCHPRSAFWSYDLCCGTKLCRVPAAHVPRVIHKPQHQCMTLEGYIQVSVFAAGAMQAREGRIKTSFHHSLFGTRSCPGMNSATEGRCYARR